MQRNLPRNRNTPVRNDPAWDRTALEQKAKVVPMLTLSSDNCATGCQTSTYESSESRHVMAARPPPVVTGTKPTSS